MQTQKKNSEIKPTGQIDEQLTSLFQELQLSTRWRRPSILFAVVRSKLVLWDAQITLNKRLTRLKQSVVHLQVDQTDYDVALRLSHDPARENTIFYISGLSHGGGEAGLNAYRALNIRRELLVDHRVRAVFWLTESEAATLMLHALDFWAFRHRVIELLDDPQPERISALLKSLNWPYWNPMEMRKEIPAGLCLRENLLNQIPDWKQAPALRAELMHMLAGLHWANAEFDQAQNLLEQALASIQNLSLAPLQARCLSALGQVSFSQGKPEQAITSCQAALKLNPDSAEVWGSLAAGYRHFHQPSLALSASMKAIELDPKMISAWITLGDLHFQAGDFAQAIPAYQKSLALNTRDAKTWVKLGDAYQALARPADALPAFKKARRLDNKNFDLWLALESVYQELGLLPSAIRALYKAARLQPLSVIPWKRLGDIYRHTNRMVSAQKAYRQALALDPHDQTSQEALARLESGKA